jgi:F-type H+-transporting ATPase subunit b
MLELNKWFFVQLFNFLFLLVLLYYILFKPLLCHLTKREDHIKGSLNTAKAVDKEKENLIHQIELKLSEARSKADTIFEELNKQGLAIQKESVDLAKKDATEINRKAKEDIVAEAKKARETLRRDVEALSKIIVEKMVRV